MYDICIIGSPIIDILACVPDSFLPEHALEKDRMYLIEQDQKNKLANDLEVLNIPTQQAPGGSAANTAKGIALFGKKVAFNGKVGSDENATIYQNKMKACGVDVFLSSGERDTAASTILITDDSARTMNTYLGSAQDFAKDDVAVDAISQSKYLYIEGYQWDTEAQKEAVRYAIKIAKEHDVKVSISLSDLFCVERHHQSFQDLLPDLDLVFCNYDEAKALTSQKDVKDALNFLTKRTAIAVITLGADGVIAGQGQVVEHVKALPSHVIDTTGAGDSFAAGFFYGILTNQSLAKSAQMGAFLASKVIEVIGPQYPDNLMTQFQKSFS